jgi:DNA-binding GntR family transcriptional regulator
VIELAQEGIVDKRPQRGIRLSSLSKDELDEAVELRNQLESYVARRLASVVTPDQVEMLRQIIEKQVRVRGDLAAFLSVDEEFHLAMPAMLGLMRTQAMLHSLRCIIWLVGAAATSRPDRDRTALDEHRALVDRIAAHDVAGAVSAVHHHVRKTGNAAQSALRDSMARIANA